MDQKTFEAGLTIVKSARERNVKPSDVWISLRAALPKEYRTDDLNEEIKRAENRVKHLKDLAALQDSPTRQELRPDGDSMNGLFNL